MHLIIEQNYIGLSGCGIKGIRFNNAMPLSISFELFSVEFDCPLNINLWKHWTLYLFELGMSMPAYGQNRNNLYHICSASIYNYFTWIYSYWHMRNSSLLWLDWCSDLFFEKRDDPWGQFVEKSWVNENLTSGAQSIRQSLLEPITVLIIKLLSIFIPVICKRKNYQYSFKHY